MCNYVLISMRMMTYHASRSHDVAELTCGLASRNQHRPMRDGSHSNLWEAVLNYKWWPLRPDPQQSRLAVTLTRSLELVRWPPG